MNIVQMEGVIASNINITVNYKEESKVNFKLKVYNQIHPCIILDSNLGEFVYSNYQEGDRVTLTGSVLTAKYLNSYGVPTETTKVLIKCCSLIREGVNVNE